MKKTKLLAFVMAAALALGMFTGCSTTTADSESTSTEGTAASYKSEFYLSDYLDEEGYIKDVDFSSAVSLSDYKSLVVPKEHHYVSDEQVADEVAFILENYFAEYEICAVEDGDTVNIDYVGTIDGVAFDGGTYAGYDLVIGSNSFIDDFEEQLIGVMVGETVDVEVTFPEDYISTDVAGKDAVFAVTVNGVDGKTYVPEYTDELVNDKIAPAYGLSVTNCEEFNSFVKESMSYSLVSTYIYNEIIGNCTVNEVPESAMNLQNDYTLANCENEAAYYGIDIDEYISIAYENESREEFLSENAAQIEGAAQEAMIIQAIAKNEGFTVTDELMEEYFPAGETFDAAVEMYGEPFLKFLIIQAEMIDMLELDTPRAE